MAERPAAHATSAYLREPARRHTHTGGHRPRRMKRGRAATEGPALSPLFFFSDLPALTVPNMCTVDAESNLCRMQLARVRRLKWCWRWRWCRHGLGGSSRRQKRWRGCVHTAPSLFHAHGGRQEQHWLVPQGLGPARPEPANATRARATPWGRHRRGREKVAPAEPQLAAAPAAAITAASGVGRSGGARVGARVKQAGAQAVRALHLADARIREREKKREMRLCTLLVEAVLKMGKAEDADACMKHAHSRAGSLGVLIINARRGLSKSRRLCSPRRRRRHRCCHRRCRHFRRPPPRPPPPSLRRTPLPTSAGTAARPAPRPGGARSSWSDCHPTTPTTGN